MAAKGFVGFLLVSLNVSESHFVENSKKDSRTEMKAPEESKMLKKLKEEIPKTNLRI